MRDPYKVLGLERSASAQDIKRAYRKLAKESHPDRHPGDKGAQARFAEINSAHEILGDKEKRQKFDNGEIDAEGKPRFQGFAGGHPGGTGGGGFENIDPRAFSDIFPGVFPAGRRRHADVPLQHRRAAARRGDAGYGGDDILSSLFGGRRGAQRAPTPGADVRGEVAVTLEDVAAGRKPKVTLPNGRTVALTLPLGVTDGQTIRLQRPGRPVGDGRAAWRRAGDGALRAASPVQAGRRRPPARSADQPRRGGARRQDRRADAFGKSAGDDPAAFLQRPRAAAEGQGPAEGERRTGICW